MNPYQRLFVLILLACLILAPLPGAQAQENPVSLHLFGADVTAYPDVTVGVSVWDADGLPIPGLTAADFTLQEDSGAPFHPSDVQTRSDAPLQVVLVLDVSTSMSGKPLADAQDAAARFLDRLTPSDRAALIAFSDALDPDPGSLNPAREIAFTANLDPIYDLVESLEAGGQTHLYNAAAKAVRLFEGQPAGHRAVLLLSDGRNEPAAVGSPDEAIRLAQAANVPFFVIGLGSDIDEPYLRRLAAETGGLFRSAPTSAELAHLFTDVAALLKTQYQLTYESQLPGDGGTHTLSVSVSAAGGTAVQEITLGPLPEVAPALHPTETPAEEIPTAEVPAAEVPAAPVTEIPLTEPAPTNGAPAAVVPVPTEIAASPAESSVPWLWVGGGVLLLIAALGGVLLRARKSKSQTEVCAQCGYDLTGRPGACPQCGSTRRLPKFRG